MVRCKTAKILWNSLTQNEGHKRRCSLFSIERQFPKLDVAGSIPIWTAGAHPENKVGPALATLSGNIRLISTAGMRGKHSWARTNTGFALAAVAGNLSFVAMN